MDYALAATGGKVLGHSPLMPQPLVKSFVHHVAAMVPPLLTHADQVCQG